VRWCALIVTAFELKNDMFSLATLQRLNSVKETAKSRRRARALNAKNKKHPKNAEKTGAIFNDLKPAVNDNYCSPAQDNLL